MTKISIVVPFYNAQATLAQCIESLLAQTYPHDAYEIILVDNNSTDASARIALQYADVKLLKEAKQGAYAARNCGIRAAREGIIAFTDPDCTVAPNWLHTISSSFMSPTVQLVMGYCHYGSQTRPMQLLAAYEAEKVAFVVDAKIPELYYGFTNNMAVRRALFNQIGLFAERQRGGDTLFVQTVLQKLGCASIQLAPAMEIYHSEMVKVRDYYQKHAIYARSNERIAQRVRYRPLTQGECWRVFQRTALKQKCSISDKLLLLMLLVPGAIIYERGRHRARARKEQLAAARHAATAFELAEDENTELSSLITSSSVDLSV